MPYTAHTWINGDSANTTKLNNLETQYTESTLSFGPDLFTAGFVLSGLAATGAAGTTTVTIGTGTAYLLQADGTTRQRKFAATTTETTSTPNTTYNLYLQPDGTFYWSTANAPAANSLHLATVATNGSGQISSITDFRTFTATMLPSMSGKLTFPNGLGVTAGGVTISAGGIAVTGASSFSGGTLTLPGGATIDTASTYNGGGTMTLNGTASLFSRAFAGSGANWYGLFNSNITGTNAVKAWTLKYNGNTGEWMFSNDTDGQIPLTLGPGTTGNTNIANSGKFGQIAGQATAGSFGVPVIVAQAIRTHVTATTLQTILSYTVGTTGVYRVALYIQPNGTSPCSLTAYLTWTDPDAAAINNPYFWASSNNSGALIRLAGASQNAGGGNTALFTLPMTVDASSGATISVSYQNTVATPSDFVSAIIERLA